ncbi:hypothetical protein AURDEDRAFT_166816 [Auricularia subglabra TFB-10046 SS5]|nr:hypothetical protein AURDEDRAFT_166816 [Auricularia subglabra TFB-10046 SS5]
MPTRPEALPGELLLLVFAFAIADDPADHARSALLRSASLVCKYWAVWAQGLLYANVSPRFDAMNTSSRGLHEALLAARPHLRLKTKSMTLRVGDVYDIPMKPESARRRSAVQNLISRHFTMRDTLRVLQAYPNVHTLKLTTHRLSPADQKFDASQKALINDHPGIRHLVLHAHVQGPELVLCQLLNAWPRLESVELAWAEVWEYQPDVSDIAHKLRIARPLTQLSEMRVFTRTTHFPWLAPGLTSSITTLRCSIDDLPTYLAFLHPTLETLVLDDGWDSPRLDDFAKCGKLRDLTILVSTMEPDELALLPRGVRRLASILDPTLLCRMVEGARFPELHTLRVAWTQRVQWAKSALYRAEGRVMEDAHLSIPRLGRLCAQRGIRFESFDLIAKMMSSGPELEEEEKRPKRPWIL